MLSYFMEREKSAQVVVIPEVIEVVTFGHRVTFKRDDGRKQAYRIVGEDEADPRAGTISYVSPVARALIGKSVGDSVAVGVLPDADDMRGIVGLQVTGEARKEQFSLDCWSVPDSRDR